jgi:hypothetical protein
MLVAKAKSKRMDAVGERSVSIVQVLLRFRFLVDFQFNDPAALRQGSKLLGIVKKQAVLGHVLIVRGLLGQGIITEDLLQPAGDRCVTVDGIAECVFIDKKKGFMTGDGANERIVRDGDIENPALSGRVPSCQ